MTITTHTLVMDKHILSISLSLSLSLSLSHTRTHTHKSQTHSFFLSPAYVAPIVEERLGEGLTERNGLKESGWEIVGNRSPNKIRNYLCRRESHANKPSYTLITKCLNFNFNLNVNTKWQFTISWHSIYSSDYMFCFIFTEKSLTDVRLIHLDS